MALIESRKGVRSASRLNASSLKRALNRIRRHVQQYAQELSSLNGLLERIASSHPEHEVTAALARSSALHSKLAQCSADLATLHISLSEGILERTTLERKLSDSEAHLLESKTELSVSQTAEKNALRLAYSDPVTGLSNRTLFNDRLHHALVQAKRHDRRVVVMFIDLDKFKAINDTHGHDRGDRVLQQVGHRLRASVRAGDTVSRRGGDEFLYLMLEAGDDASVTNLARKIVDNIAQPFQFGRRSMKITASIGIAIYPEDAHSAEALLRNADIAMYEAKQGNNGPMLFSELARLPPRELVGSERSA